MKDYNVQLRRHMGQYKLNHLKVSDNGTWDRSRTEYEHILPRDLYRLNILPDIQESFWEYFSTQRFSLHKYFHHLTSSQAMCFNLFYPFVGQGFSSDSVLLDALGYSEQKIARIVFEDIPNEAEGTNFDLAIYLATGERIYFEVKLAEQGFGSAKNDERHQTKLETIYRPMLIDKVVPAALEDSVFFRNYQIMRNIAYSGPHCNVVFLVPRANNSLKRGLTFLKSVLLPETSANVRVLYLEDFVQALFKSERFKSHMSQFTAKYMFTETIQPNNSLEN